MTVIEREFARAGDGARPAAFPPAEWYAGTFYPGRRYYIFWSNCNTWTLRALADAKLGGTRFPVMFEGQVGGALDGFERVR